jgi:hypothetical protein
MKSPNNYNGDSISIRSLLPVPIQAANENWQWNFVETKQGNLGMEYTHIVWSIPLSSPEEIGSPPLIVQL